MFYFIDPTSTIITTTAVTVPSGTESPHLMITTSGEIPLYVYSLAAIAVILLCVLVGIMVCCIWRATSAKLRKKRRSNNDSAVLRRNLKCVCDEVVEPVYMYVMENLYENNPIGDRDYTSIEDYKTVAFQETNMDSSEVPRLINSGKCCESKSAPIPIENKSYYQKLITVPLKCSSTSANSYATLQITTTHHQSCEKQVVHKLERDQQLNNTSSKQSRASCSTHCLDGDFGVDKNETIHEKEQSLKFSDVFFYTCKE